MGVGLLCFGVAVVCVYRQKVVDVGCFFKRVASLLVCIPIFYKSFPWLIGFLPLRPVFLLLTRELVHVAGSKKRTEENEH